MRKKLAEIYGVTLWENEIHSDSTDGDIHDVFVITGAAVHVQIMFPLKDNKCRVFEDIFSGT